MRRNRRKHCIILFLSSISLLTLLKLENHWKLVRQMFPPVQVGPCYIPRMDPFEPSRIERIEEKYAKEGSYQPVHCLKNPKFTTDLNSTLFRLSPESTFWSEVNCSYNAFARVHNYSSGDSNQAMFTNAESISITSDSTLIPGTINFIRVQCENQTVPGQMVLTDFFHFVRINQSLVKLIAKEQEYEGKHAEERVNVVVIVMDALSHMNFLRYFPKTREYLTKTLSSKVVTADFRGYNKVGDHSMDNATPLLTGLHWSEIQQIGGCWDEKKESAFLRCPVIWKEFRRKGYMTSYAEDDTTYRDHLWAFELHGKRGLENRNTGSTDYDIITLTERLESFQKSFGYKNGSWWGPRICWGYREKFEILLDNIIQTAKMLPQAGNYFQFSWETYLTHDVSRVSSFGDPLLVKLFQELNNLNALNNTAVILMGDHGLWNGENREYPSYQEILEGSMPLLYMVLPAWFRDRYPTAMSNLELNTAKLTTHFDTHEVLRDLSDLSTLEETAVRSRSLRPMDRGISLFLPIPENRTCESASIPPTFCSCSYSMELSVTQSEVRIVAQWVLDSVKSNVPRSTAAPEIKQILKASKRIPYHHELVDLDVVELGKLNMAPVYEMTFEVTPTGCIYAASVMQTETSWEVQGNVRNLNCEWKNSA